MTKACAAIVAQDDPQLHATALFAPEPARSWLMVLYAFDIELGRAAQPSEQPMIPLMRLQWWRDVAEGAATGAPPLAHEVAGPLARLIAERGLPAEAIAAMIAARETELDAGLDGDFDAARFSSWANGRFGALTALAALLLSEDNAETVALARRAGPVRGAAFALRHAAAPAHRDRFLLPGLTAEDRAALAEGRLSGHAAGIAGRVAKEALADLARLRSARRAASRRATPAFLPLIRAGHVLARAAAIATRRAEGSAGTPVDIGELDRARPFDGLRLAFAAACGLW